MYLALLENELDCVDQYIHFIEDPAKLTVDHFREERYSHGLFAGLYCDICWKNSGIGMRAGRVISSVRRKSLRRGLNSLAI